MRPDAACEICDRTDLPLTTTALHGAPLDLCSACYRGGRPVALLALQTDLLRAWG